MRSLLCSALLLLSAMAAPAADASRHVILVIFDGLRPDFVTPANTPNLWQLRERGVFFAHHHAVYLSATEVNGTALATGCYPAHSGLIANTEYRPTLNPTAAVGTEKPATIRRGDALTGGHYLQRPTVAEILHQHGLRTAVAGSKQVVLLQDRAERENDDRSSPVVFEGAVLPTALAPELARLAGPFPPIAADENKRERDAWTTRVLTAGLWRDGVPALSILWLAEPDASQHASGPGSPAALAGIRSSDDNLGRVLAELARRALLATTDVLVVSDHGFSTVAWKHDVAETLRTAGLDVVRRTTTPLATGQVLAVSNGGSTLFYVGGHDRPTVERLVGALERQHLAGVILTRGPLPGTFPLEAAHIDSADAPDVVASLPWTSDAAPNGTAGLQTSDLRPNVAKGGNHASLSPFDLHNTLVAAGPDFRVGVTDTLPSGNTDVAPTLLWCLGFKDAARQMDGRPLSEALRIEAPPLRSYELRQLTAECPAADGGWHQELRVAEVNGVRYLDEGTGRWTPREPPAAPTGRLR